ncbi:MAG: phosphate ABC transporter substrate-binding protein [Spirochaetaceae bacterium]
MKRLIIFSSMLTILTVAAYANGQQEGEGGNLRLSMGGSTTMDPIMSSAIEVYRTEVDADAELSYDAPGSTAGIQGTLNGIYDIGASSRALFIRERQQGLAATTIATDGLAVIVHETVPIDDISLKDLAAVFVGEIDNWSELGGPDEEITIVRRDQASGTFGAFLERVLVRTYGDDARYRRQALVTESNGNMATMVTQTPYSIGYASLVTIERVEDEGGKALSVDGVPNTLETVLTGEYPITRPLNLVTVGEPTGKEKTFADFLLSARGQEIVQEVGYLPLR